MKFIGGKSKNDVVGGYLLNDKKKKNLLRQVSSPSLQEILGTGKGPAIQIGFFDLDWDLTPSIGRSASQLKLEYNAM
jgi:hypothetical protein